MTPEAFHKSVLPIDYGALSEHCLCSHSGFRKLLSFNFADYGTSPMALFDSETVIDCFLRHDLCRRIGEYGRNSDGDGVQNYHLTDDAQWQQFCDKLKSVDWVSYIQPPPTDTCTADQVVRYLTRSLTGFPINDGRIVAAHKGCSLVMAQIC